MVAAHDLDFSVKIAGLELKNPVLLASGTCGYGAEVADLVGLSASDPDNSPAAIVVKGISLAPRPGNPPPRLAETPCGLLNSIGLENVGLDAFLREKLPWLEKINAAVIVNILGNSVDEYAELASQLNVSGVDALEVNISCPNVKEGGVAFGTDPKMAAKVTEAVRKASKKPVIIKLSPNVTDICLIARACEETGADALSLINTLLGMAIDIKKRRPVLSNIFGGLSGPAIKPVALRMVWQVSRAVNIPVIGIGGISSWQDAVEFFMAGAVAVEIGTASMISPSVVGKTVLGIKKFMLENEFDSMDSMRIR